MKKAIYHEVNKVKGLTIGSDYYNTLLGSGIDPGELDSFIRDGHTLKKSDAVDEGVGEDLEKLFDLGGSVAGGGALAAVFLTHKARDLDVFFSDPVSYVAGILATRGNRRIDVCFCIGRAYDSFDLAVTKCSVSREHVNVHGTCLDAMETGLSEICPQSIIYPDATLRRMLKYHSRIGVRFRMDQVLALCAVHSVDDHLAYRVLTECVG